MAELGDVQGGAQSPLLTPGTAKDRPKGTSAQNTVKAHAKAAAIEIYSALTDRAAWDTDQAASEIAKIFQERGIKVRSGKSPTRRDKSDGTVTPDTVKEWVKQSHKKDLGPNPRRVANHILFLRKLISELWGIEDVCLPVMEFYSEELSSSPVIGYGRIERTHLRLNVHPGIADEDRCQLLLNHLRRYIAGTTYET